MMFCPKCGSIMLPQTKGGKKITACKCGYVSKEQAASIKETITTKKDNVGVIDSDIETLPETEAECPKCKNTKAFYWTQQTRAADEGETKFMKCASCKYTWRDYG